ncbi:hypothetical protein [Brevundimonas sp.]|uniref:hypothetical protein n=1 Tax=Brevundimonas sp. TaxID=1871086 RepID=UPI0035AEEEC0
MISIVQAETDHAVIIEEGRIALIETDHSISIEVGKGLTVNAPLPIQVTQTIEGEAGPSAYAVAVRNGFVGSPSQWLASLKGDPGDTVATDPGDLTLIFNNHLI